MKTTVFTCDICKASKGKEDLVSFKITPEGLRIANADGGRSYSVEKDVCKDCLRKKGFHIAPLPDEHPDGKESANANRKTLESKLVDFLEDLGVAFVE